MTSGIQKFLLTLVLTFVAMAVANVLLARTLWEGNAPVSDKFVRTERTRDDAPEPIYYLEFATPEGELATRVEAGQYARTGLGILLNVEVRRGIFFGDKTVQLRK